MVLLPSYLPILKISVLRTISPVDSDKSSKEETHGNEDNLS